MSNYFLRGIFFFTIVILWYVGGFWISLPLCIWYSYRYTAYELVVLGVCIDVQFQSYISWPLYTTVSLSLVVALEWLRPHLVLYTKHL